ncbi:MAG TPA: bifunctional diaminohydroxyphosphoribosylaminopyrimidine deaminase/5-amino-6-(5-phosphoribosylamino)uracil reductase RibD [Edaphocola sp.]|nr:bifunctional diaminohydroxyphosphoribosylaminopyrimidine deaminase/5-amino-6-(5-phosphoribosylamino)uracil reductase RibD [Edaphocola sp.]
MVSDEQYMRRCLELAQKGINHAAPNPMVGSVLVHQERIIGEGWHEVYGQAHAEVNCLNDVRPEDRALIPGSRLYVSLEPCSHFGKTPPCCDRIIMEGIREVVVGCRDSYAAVAGKGIQKMKDAGILVRTGTLETECRELNKRFFTVQEKGRPYIILKWAETADGFIAAEDGTRIRISGWIQQRLVHRMRYQESAVLVGYQAALNDNPRLDNRFWREGRQPLRVLIDFDNSLPGNYFLKDNSRGTLIFNGHKEGEAGHMAWKRLYGKKDIPQQITAALEGINSIIVEGGTKTLQTFIDSGLWDEAHRWINGAMVAGTGIQSPVLKNARKVQEQCYGADRLLLFRQQ